MHFTGFLKIVLAPGVIVCLCVTDTSKNRAKTGPAAPAVLEPNLQLGVWLARMAILSAAY